MRNKGKELKKCRRKIRIKLSDPNNPDSYICEVFDSSYEDEAEQKNPEPKENNSRPKNYFDVLMSKDCRKSGKIKVNGEIEADCEREAVIKSEDEKRTKKVEEQRRKKEEVTFCKKKETDSSDDENLLQIQKKCRLEKSSPEEIVTCDANVTKDSPEIIESDEELFTIFESPKNESNKKTLSILNYFSRTNLKGAENGLSNPCGVKSSKTGGSRENPENVAEKKSRSNEPNKENIKLAPLFCKKEKKIFDPAAQKARLDFLYNTPPIVRKSDKCNENDVGFPEVVHVQQKNDSARWLPREVLLPLRESSTPKDVPRTDRTFRFTIPGPSPNTDPVPHSKTPIDKELINKLKSKYLNLNLESVIENLKGKRDEFRSLEERLGKHSKGSDETGHEVLNALWVDKYKPKSGDILGNAKALKKLREWLESWKSFDQTLKALMKSGTNGKKDSDDDDAFVDSDDEDYGLKTPGNVCILSGPHASGKTSLVFALASELEFKVLELNASSKRTGKKVLSDLQEATQSHKVHHLNVLQNEIPPKETMKRKKKRRRKSRNTDGVAKVPNNSDCKISLILIEDADVVFEDHDEGFISAITSLAQTSKRPLIFVANDGTCPYLENFKKDQCLILEMERPCFYKSRALLDVVSSLEGAQTDGEFLNRLIRRNCFDLRRSLLELEFWSQFGEKSPIVQNEFDLGKLWWGLGEFLHKTDIRRHVTAKGFKRKRQNDFFDSSDEESTVKKPKLSHTSRGCLSVVVPDATRGKPSPVIGPYFEILNSVSIVDGLRVGSFNENRPKDGLSLEENLEEVSCGESLADTLSKEVVKLSTEIFARDLREKKNEERKFEFSSPGWEEIRWQQSQNKASDGVSVLIPPQSVLDQRGLRLDYLPVIRNICRVEKTRSETHPKRRNRFYHYLSNLAPKLDDDDLDANCKILTR